jgi:hypothetical protein
VISSNPAAKISLILPNSIEINSVNAVANGFTFTVPTPADLSALETPSFLSLAGTHTLVQIPISAPGGGYQLKVDTTGISTPTDLAVFYMSSSPVRMGGLASGSVYSVGQQAVLSALLASDTASVTGATVSGSVQVIRDVSPQVTIGNYQFVSQVNGPDGYVQYTYSARATNNGASLNSVQAMGSYAGGSFFSGQIVSFGPLSAGAAGNGLNNFTVALPQGTSFNSSALTWTVRAASPPVAISFADTGSFDAQPGDGIYTAVFPVTEAGKHQVTLNATGTFGGTAFARTAGFEFDAISASGAWGSFTSRGLNRKGNTTGGLANYDSIEVTANVVVPQAGRYRLSIDLVNTSQGVSVSDAYPETAIADVTASAAGNLAIKLVFPAKPSFRSATSLSLQNASLYLLDNTPGRTDREKSLVAYNASPGSVGIISASDWERPFSIAASGHSATLINTNAIITEDILRITVALTSGRLGPCNYSGTLSASDGRIIQNINGAFGSTGQIVSAVNFDFAGGHIGRAGIGGPFTLSFASINCREGSATAYKVFQTPPYSLSQFPNAQTSPWTFTMELDRTTVTLAATGEVYLNAIIAPSNGFMGDYTPSVSGLPPGVAAQFMPLPPWRTNYSPPIAPRISSRSGILLTSTNAAPGVYPLIFSLTSGSIVRTANFTLTIGATVPAIVSASPAERSVSVDGVSGSGSRTFNWQAGSSHTLDVASPQVDGAGVKWVFDRWSDGGAKNRTVTPKASFELSARMIREWTDTVLVSTGVPVYDGSLAAWTRPVSIQNTGTASIVGPVYLGIASPSERILLLAEQPQRIADVRAVRIPSNGIAPGATIVGAIVYLPTDGTQQFTYTPRVFAGPASFEPGIATEITGQFTITLGAASINPSSGRIQQPVTFVNNGPPVQNGILTVQGLPPGYSLFSATGVTSVTEPIGIPYIDRSWAAGSTSTILEFTKAGNPPPLAFTLRVFGPGQR